MRVRLVKSFDFEAAHWLPSFPDGHKCRRLHGHSFRADVVVEGDAPESSGFLMDYGHIKAAIEPVRLDLDHRCLNEVPGLENPTSEVIARWIWRRLRPGLPMLVEVIVHETCSTRCHYSGG